MTRGMKQFRVRPPRCANAGGRAASRRRVGRVTSRPALEASIFPFGRSQTGRNVVPAAASSVSLRASACDTPGAGRMQRSAPHFRTRAA